MKFYLDIEFIEMGHEHPVHLVSLGIVAQDGREFYAESDEAPLELANLWVTEHVIGRLTGPKMSRDALRRGVLEFIGNPASTGSKPEFWGYYADYDWVVFCQLFGAMIDFPQGWPMYCRDLKQLADDLGNPALPNQDPKEEHHALFDARWNRKVYDHLAALRPQRDWKVVEVPFI